MTLVTSSNLILIFKQYENANITNFWSFKKPLVVDLISQGFSENPKIV